MAPVSYTHLDVYKRQTYARHIGIGGIATAGVIGIINSWGIIKGAVGLAAKELKGKTGIVQTEEIRTQKDLSMKVIAIGIFATLIVTYLFFHFGVLDNWYYALIGLLIVGIIAFLFTTVAANAIAIVGTNPVSGMTLMTLILASIILVAVGLKGTAGMVSALIIGCLLYTSRYCAGRLRSRNRLHAGDICIVSRLRTMYAGKGHDSLYRSGVPCPEAADHSHGL